MEFSTKRLQLTSAFLGYMEQPYTKKLQERAGWVVTTFGSYSDGDLVDFFKQNLDRWGGGVYSERTYLRMNQREAGFQLRTLQ